jgi:MFS family permease
LCCRDAAALVRVQAAFALGYAFSQLAGRLTGNRWGNRRIQVLAMLACILGLALTPLFITADGPGPSARSAEALCFSAAFCLGAQHATTAALKTNWRLPSESSWAGLVDLAATLAGSLLNCLVVAPLIQVLSWRLAMPLLAALTAVALVGFASFVTDAPTARGGRLRLSDGEAALFRAEGMLADEPPTDAKSSPTSGDGVGGGSIRDKSDYHFRKTSTEYDSKYGIKWLSCIVNWSDTRI